MNYILIEEKAWQELKTFTNQMIAKMRLLEHRINPIEKEGWINNEAVCK